MADSHTINKPHHLDPELTSSMRPNPSKFYLHFFFKSLIILFALVILPLFPSQAPQFLNQSSLTKLWELLHLLFIGVVVSYGLCSRRNAPLNIETHSNTNATQTYLSGISHISAIFENGFENLCGSDEKKMMGVFTNGSYVLDECKNPRSSVFSNGFKNPHGFDENKMNQSESMGVFTNGSSVIDECKDPRYSILKNGSENRYGYDENMKQAWNYQYFQGESVVGVVNGDYVLDQWGKPKSRFEYKPLGLPVRSLRSRIVETATHESVNLGGSSSWLKDSSKGADKINKGAIRGLIPTNLEEKFEETVVSSPIPWASRSGRMEMREKEENIKPPSHCRPLSVGEFEFQCLKSPSFRSPKSSLSYVSPELPNPKMEDLKRERNFHRSSLPNSISSVAPLKGEASVIGSSSLRFSVGSSLSSVSPELPNPKMEDSKREKTFNMSSLPNLISSVAPLNGEALVIGSSSQRFGVGSSLSSVSPELPNPKMEDSNREKKALHRSSLPAPINGEEKSFFSSKTRRFSIGSSSEMNAQRSTKDKLKDFGKSKIGGKQGMDSLNSVVKPPTISKALSRGKSVRTIRSSEKFEVVPIEENLPDNTRKQNLDNLGSSMANSTFLKYQKGVKQELADGTTVESEEDSESEFENFKVSSYKEEARSEIGGDNAEPDSGEVDRKAGEFIAKFKEQIRLQKAASIKGLHFW